MNTYCFVEGQIVWYTTEGDTSLGKVVTVAASPDLPYSIRPLSACDADSGTTTCMDVKITELKPFDIKELPKALAKSTTKLQLLSKTKAGGSSSPSAGPSETPVAVPACREGGHSQLGRSSGSPGGHLAPRRGLAGQLR